MSEVLFCFFLWKVLMFYLISDSSEKYISLDKGFVNFVKIAIEASPQHFEEFLSKTFWFFSLVWFLRQNFLNSRQKYFRSCQKCISSQNFSNSGETFQQNCQKCILRVRRNTLTKKLLAFWNSFRSWARKFRICGKKFAGLLSNEHYLFPDGQLEEYFCKKFYFFILFRTSR